jgi:hypothetical protein
MRGLTVIAIAGPPRRDVVTDAPDRAPEMRRSPDSHAGSRANSAPRASAILGALGADRDSAVAIPEKETSMGERHIGGRAG